MTCRPAGPVQCGCSGSRPRGGACFITIRWGLRDAPVLWFATQRAILAGMALVAVGTARRRPPPTGITAWSLVALSEIDDERIATVCHVLLEHRVEFVVTAASRLRAR